MVHLALAGGVVYALTVTPERAASLPLCPSSVREGGSVLRRGGADASGGTGGSGWQAVALPVRAAADVAVHPADPQVLYVVGEDGVQRTADGGAT